LAQAHLAEWTNGGFNALRENIASSETTIYDLVKSPLGSFTLTAPLDSALVDDSRVY
jgi:hypothetical protein